MHFKDRDNKNERLEDFLPILLESARTMARGTEPDSILLVDEDGHAHAIYHIEVTDLKNPPTMVPAAPALPSSQYVNRPMAYILADDKETPIPVDYLDPRASDMFGEFERRRTATTTVNGWKVSTVFLVFDHGFEGPPLLWETMVFAESPEDPKKKWDDRFCERYSTKREALAGHYAVVGMLYAGVQPEGGDV